MNIFNILLGAMTLKSFGKGGDPKEIRELKNQLPAEERSAVLQGYKQLPDQSKKDFRAALRNADMAAASQILGQDLTKYNISLDKKDATKTAQVDTASPESDFAARIDRILAVPMDINPELVAQAAKRYEEAVPRGSEGNIVDKTKKLIELKG